MEDYERIELRSEKIRSMISQVPPQLMRNGISIIFLFIVLLFIGIYYIPYPESIHSDIIILSTNGDKVYAESKLPYVYITKISEGTSVKIDLEGYNKNQYGQQKGVISHINHQVVNINGKNYFTITLELPTSLLVQKDMTGTAYILLSDKSILEHIFN